MYAENGESFLQLQYSMQETSRQSNNDWNIDDETSESESSGSKYVIRSLKHFALEIAFFARLRRRLERLRRAAASKLCCQNCKLCLVGLLIGSLIASIGLAAVLAMWLKPGTGKDLVVLFNYVVNNIIRVPSNRRNVGSIVLFSPSPSHPQGS